MQHSELARIQRNFLTRVSQNTHDPRLRVYHNNTISILVRALTIIYPTSLRVVGDACFQAIARQYTVEHPCHVSNLDDYGHDFDVFWQNLLPEQPHLQTLPYLPDLLRFERARHITLTRATDTKTNWQSVEMLSPQDVLPMQPILNPHLHIIHTPYPLLELFEPAPRHDHTEILYVQHFQNTLQQGTLTKPLAALLHDIAQNATMLDLQHLGHHPQTLADATRMGFILGLRHPDENEHEEVNSS